MSLYHRMNTWDRMLPVLEFATNNSWQEGIQDTPFFTNYGTHPHMPDDVKAGKPSKDPKAYNFLKEGIENAVAKAKTCWRHAQHCQNQDYGAKCRELQYNVGDKVWFISKNIPLQRCQYQKNSFHSGLVHFLCFRK